MHQQGINPLDLANMDPQLLAEIRRQAEVWMPYLSCFILPRETTNYGTPKTIPGIAGADEPRNAFATKSPGCLCPVLL